MCRPAGSPIIRSYKMVSQSLLLFSSKNGKVKNLKRVKIFTPHRSKDSDRQYVNNSYNRDGFAGNITTQQALASTKDHTECGKVDPHLELRGQEAVHAPGEQTPTSHQVSIYCKPYKRDTPGAKMCSDLCSSVCPNQSNPKPL